jgi:hypothetical protein
MNRNMSSEIQCVQNVYVHLIIMIQKVTSNVQNVPRQKALGTLPENGNVMPKRVGATIHD